MEGHGVDSSPTELMRRTGACCFIFSTAIRHHKLIVRAVGGPFQHFVGQHPCAARDISLIVLVA
ncbi:uncharacterized protein METZ01_LOCUS306794, partial [marine metagenome]